MRVLSGEPDKSHRRILRKSKSLPENLRLSPYFVGESDNHYICGLCGHELAKFVNREQLEELVLECPICGSLNERP